MQCPVPFRNASTIPRHSGTESENRICGAGLKARPCTCTMAATKQKNCNKKSVCLFISRKPLKKMQVCFPPQTSEPHIDRFGALSIVAHAKNNYPRKVPIDPLRGGGGRRSGGGAEFWPSDAISKCKPSRDLKVFYTACPFSYPSHSQIHPIVPQTPPPSIVHVPHSVSHTP